VLSSKNSERELGQLAQRACTLADLIDIEAFLAADRLRSDNDLIKRDREIGSKLNADFPSRSSQTTRRRNTILGWCHALTENLGVTSYGQRFIHTLNLIELSLVAAGVFLGIATVRVVLRYDGSTPVNIVHFLAVLVVTQVFLFLLMIMGTLFRRFLTAPFGKVARFGPLQELIKSFVWSKVKLPVAIERTQKFYGNVLGWRLVTATQKFGIAFNLAALATLTYLIIFTDLAFSWSTSLNLSAKEAHHLIKIIAWPWDSLSRFSDFGKNYVPTLELVEKTQYFRIDGRYIAASPADRALDVKILGSWWPFLSMALAIYGLLPRAIFYVFAKLAFLRAVRFVKFDTIELEVLYQRLVCNVASAGQWQHRGDERMESFLKDGKKSGVQEISKEIKVQNTQCDVIIWRDIPVVEASLREHLYTNYRLEVKSVYNAGGKAHDSYAEKLLTNLKAAKNSVVIAVEAWESPGKAIKSLLQTLREGLGGSDAKRPLFIILVQLDKGQIHSPSQARIDLWKKALNELSDPYSGLLKHASLQ
jgi:hypothetical protein